MSPRSNIKDVQDAARKRLILKILRLSDESMTLRELCHMSGLAINPCKRIIQMLLEDGDIGISGRAKKKGGTAILYSLVGE